jgi:hypothetical protein
MFTNDQIFRIALEQSAADLSARREDFLKGENVIVTSRADDNARKYLELPFLCQLVSYGNNIVASVSPEFYEITRKYIEKYPTEHAFETPNIHVLDSGIDGLVASAATIKYKKYQFYLSHHPTLTSNLDKTPFLKMHLINLFGHTHQQNHFHQDIPYMFHVGMDSNNCTPVLLDDAIEMMKQEFQKCIDLVGED